MSEALSDRLTVSYTAGEINNFKKTSEKHRGHFHSVRTEVISATVLQKKK